jgi:hypothetical protein
MKNTLDLEHSLAVLKKEEEKLMRRVQKMVDSTFKYAIEEKIRGLRVVISIAKQANLEYDNIRAEF